jgi:hypothetical protein
VNQIIYTHTSEADKRFCSLRALAAMNGIELLRTNPNDGPVRYLGIRCGKACEMGSSLDLVERFILVMGGQE